MSCTNLSTTNFGVVGRIIHTIDAPYSAPPTTGVTQHSSTHCQTTQNGQSHQLRLYSTGKT